MSIRSLDELDLEHRAEFGGKAAHLGHAARLGCPVLRGVALSTGLFQRFVEQGGLLGEVSSILNTMQPQTMAQFQAAAWAIHSAFRVRRLPDDVRQTLVEAWDRVQAPSVSVRSSATNEDSPRRSFVGQHASTLNLQSADALVDAALECWSSLFSAKSLAYAQRFGVDLLTSSMGLIVQPMVESEARGALFTVDPITGDPDRFILEVHQGREPGVFDLDPYQRRPGELSYWSQLRRYGLLLDEHDLTYQAIEWVICGGALTFLRVRPATAVPACIPERRRPAELAELMRLMAPEQVSGRALRPFTRYHLSRLGLGETGPDRPLPTGEPDRAQVCGYLYRAVASDDESGGSGGGLALLTQTVRSMAAGSRTDQDISAQLTVLTADLEGLELAELTPLTNDDLADRLTRLQQTGDALRDNCLQSRRATRAILQALAQIHREWAHSTIEAAVLLGSDPAAAAITTQEDGCSGQDELLDDLIAHDVLSESKTGEQVAARAGSDDARQPGDDWRQTEAGRAERAVAENLSRWQRSLYARLLDRARSLHGLAVQAVAHATVCRALERAVILEAGRRLKAAGAASRERDAALLEPRELDRWLRGEVQDEQAMRLIIRRRDEDRRSWRYSPPRRLLPGEGEPLAEIDLDSCDLVLKGRAVSAGIVSGRARVVRSLRESSAVLPGEVLICTEATFELSPLFSMVSALVAEKGSLLDHGSVLVREYGLPTVFAVENALGQLKTGDELIVDAVRGVVGRRRATVAVHRSVLDEL